MSDIELFLTTNMETSERRKLAKLIKPPKHLKADWEKVKRLYTDERMDKPRGKDLYFEKQLEEATSSVFRLLRL